MKYSKATSYALHTMLYMIADTAHKPVGVQLLAEKQGVSPTYLSKILTKLVKAGLIESATGAGGGYRLKKSAEEISFLDVIHAIEGLTSLFECVDHHDSQCQIHQVMLAAEKEMEQHLHNKKLVDLVPHVR